MTSANSSDWKKGAISIVASGIGGATAGPLGAALGSWLGGIVGESAGKLIDELGKKAVEKIVDLGGDYVGERLNDPAPKLEGVVRLALQLSLREIRSATYSDWFDHWDRRFDQPVESLGDSRPGISAQALLSSDPIAVEQEIAMRFRSTMERLDGEGSALDAKSNSLKLSIRAMPDELFAYLVHRLPEVLRINFEDQLTKSANDEAWKQHDLRFKEKLSSTIAAIDAKSDALPRIKSKLDTLQPIVVPTTYALPALGLFIGRDEEREVALERWVTDRHRPLLICGPPGIGKSTLALALLHHPDSERKFGPRRYRLRCDPYSSSSAMIAAMALEWFGLTPNPRVAGQLLYQLHKPQRP